VPIDEIEIGDVFRVPVLAPLLEGDIEGFEALRNFAERLLTNPRTRKTTVTDAEVAKVYREAFFAGRSVIDAVAGRFGWRRQTAKNRIHGARKAHLLPETVRGSARA
jgi:hypothetical protein